VTASAPQTVVTPEETDPKPQPASEISFRNLIFETEFVDFDGSYATLDPGGSGIPAILASAVDMIPDGGTTDPDAKMKVEVSVAGMAAITKNYKDGQVYNAVKYGSLVVTFERIDIPHDPAPIGTTLSNIFKKGRLVDSDEEKPFTAEEKRTLAVELISGSCKKMRQLKPEVLSTQNFEERFS
jgi:hypothetical protein